MVNNVNFIEALDRNTKGWCNIYQGRGTGAFGRGTGTFSMIEVGGPDDFSFSLGMGRVLFFRC